MSVSHSVANAPWNTSIGSDSSWNEGKRVGSWSYTGSEYRDTA